MGLPKYREQRWNLRALTFRSLFVLNSKMPRRRYPPPWKIEEGRESFIVTDATGQRLAFIYFENEPQRQSIMKRINRDDAWQLARAITRIPALLERG